MNEEEIRQIIQEEIAKAFQNLELSDRYTFQKHLQMFDGRNIQLGVNTGTKIGTATTQKIGLYGKTPVVQASAIGAPTTPSAAYAQSEAQSAVDAINSIRTALTNIGITA